MKIIILYSTFTIAHTWTWKNKEHMILKKLLFYAVVKLINSHKYHIWQLTQRIPLSRMDTTFTLEFKIMSTFSNKGLPVFDIGNMCDSMIREK